MARKNKSRLDIALEDGERLRSLVRAQAQSLNELSNQLAAAVSARDAAGDKAEEDRIIAEESEKQVRAARDSAQRSAHASGQQAERLRGALRKYGKHPSSCPRCTIPAGDRTQYPTLECWCGLDAALAPSAPARPRVVCLCGSTRFKDQYIAENERLTFAGEIVLTVGAFIRHAEKFADPSVGKALDELHKRKIDMADYVRILNVGGYVGDSTRSEIAYATKTGKPVEYLEPIASASASAPAPPQAEPLVTCDLNQQPHHEHFAALHPPPCINPRPVPPAAPAAEQPQPVAPAASGKEPWVCFNCRGVFYGPGAMRNGHQVCVECFHEASGGEGEPSKPGDRPGEPNPCDARIAEAGDILRAVVSWVDDVPNNATLSFVRARANSWLAGSTPADPLPGDVRWFLRCLSNGDRALAYVREAADLLARYPKPEAKT